MRIELYKILELSNIRKYTSSHTINVHSLIVELKQAFLKNEVMAAFKTSITSLLAERAQPQSGHKNRDLRYMVRTVKPGGGSSTVLTWAA